MINSEQPNDSNILKKDRNIRAFRTDLTNLVITEHNCKVESVPELLDNFNRLYTGYKQLLEYQDQINEAEKLNSWGWI